MAMISPANKRKHNQSIVFGKFEGYLLGLYPIQDKGEPQTRRVATAAPVSAAKTNKCPSEEPAANATPKG